MELRQLKYFLTAADKRSFVGAANELYISRQAISKAISHLESELNTELFMRDSNGAFLTPAGVKFYDRVRNNVLELEKAMEDMRRNSGQYLQEIRILFTASTVRLYENDLIAFRDSRTNLRLQYSEESEEVCHRQLAGHSADLAVCTYSSPDPQFLSEEILCSPYGLLAGKGMLREGKSAVRCAELQGLPLAGLCDRRTAALCETHGFSLAFSGYDAYRLFSLAADGRCAMLIPKALAPKEFPALRWIPLEDAEPWRLYRLSLRTMEHNILFNTVLDDLQAGIFDRVLSRIPG